MSVHDKEGTHIILVLSISLIKIMWIHINKCNRVKVALNNNGCLRLMSTKTKGGLNSETAASFVYTELPNKSYIKLIGPEAPKFLNGLVTTKLLPSFVKKNLTTISPGDEGKLDASNDTEVKFDDCSSNWGIYNESSYNGSYLSRFGTYTGFLNSKGKLISDSIIYPTPVFLSENSLADKKSTRHPAYLLEFDSSIVNRILGIFETHRLNSKIRYGIVSANKLKTWEIMIKLPTPPPDHLNPWIENVLDPLSLVKNTNNANDLSKNILSMLFKEPSDNFKGIYIDRRMDMILDNDNSSPQLIRVVTTSEIDDIYKYFNKESFPFPVENLKVTPEYFKQYRLKNGLIDGMSDVKTETIWPLELNYDFFVNTLSADKGCYLGQEITHRMISTDLLKKRLLPVKLVGYEQLSQCNNDGKYKEITFRRVVNKIKEIEPNVTDPLPSPIYNPFPSTNIPKSQRPVGSLISSEGEDGVALIRTEYFDMIFNDSNRKHRNKLLITLESEFPDHKPKTIEVIPRIPFWLESWKENSQ